MCGKVLHYLTAPKPSSGADILYHMQCRSFSTCYNVVSYYSLSEATIRLMQHILGILMYTRAYTGRSPGRNITGEKSY